jgi:primosomal protein N'
MEILEIIADFIRNMESDMAFVSELKSQEIDPRTAEEFLRIIEYCQQEVPRVRIEKLGDRPIITSALDDPSALIDTLGSEPVSYNRRQSFIQMPKKIMYTKLRCTNCNEDADYPTHCGRVMTIDLENKDLVCDACGIHFDVPQHCKTHMSVEYSDGEQVIALVRVR